jgi:phosphohistidine phosphatase SixA
VTFVLIRLEDVTWMYPEPMKPTVAVAFLLGAAVASLAAQDASSAALVEAMRRGGLVIVMRHAASPREAPAAAAANRDNATRERQLDQAGRATATAMGQAIRALKIPIGVVLTSPTYRALETVKYLGLSNPDAVTELGDGGRSMGGVTDAQAAWLRTRASTRPAAGTNTLIVTHSPNLSRAFPAWGTVADGESVVVRPDGTSFEILGRIPIERWMSL